MTKKKKEEEIRYNRKGATQFRLYTSKEFAIVQYVNGFTNLITPTKGVVKGLPKEGKIGIADGRIINKSGEDLKIEYDFVLTNI